MHSNMSPATYRLVDTGSTFGNYLLSLLKILPDFTQTYVWQKASRHPILKTQE